VSDSERLSPSGGEKFSRIRGRGSVRGARLVAATAGAARETIMRGMRLGYLANAAAVVRIVRALYPNDAHAALQLAAALAGVDKPDTPAT
jgi:hypothetical protein